MIEFLYSIDVSIFYFINDTLSAKFLDKFFTIITNVNHWYIAYAILLGIAFFKGGSLGKWSVLGVILLIITTDQVSHKVIKEIFQRIRPCNALPNVNSPLGLQGTFSFPSNHAVNNFAVAVFFYMIYPNLKWILFISAALVALSRVYIGLHYPSDVIGGALIGSAFGYLFALLTLKTNKYFLKNKKVNDVNSN